MLILMRRLDERIMIGDDIVITVAKIQGGQVHLGIDAPREINVAREEVYKTPKKEEDEEREMPEKGTTWCMCEEVDAVFRDKWATCGHCGGRDAYKKNAARPKTAQ